MPEKMRKMLFVGRNSACYKTNNLRSYFLAVKNHEKILKVVNTELPDIVVIDVGWVGLSRTYDIIDKIRLFSKRIKIIALIKWPNTEEAAGILRKGAFSYIFVDWPDIDSAKLLTEQIKTALKLIEIEEKENGIPLFKNEQERFEYTERQRKATEDILEPGDPDLLR